MPLVLSHQNKTLARQLQRQTQRGELRRLREGIYTDELSQPPETIVRRELLSICALLAPGALISHRSALASTRISPAGNVFLTGPYRRDIQLPGLKLRIVKGPGPLDSDIRIPTFGGDAFISSQARALLENLTSSRGDPEEKRTIGPEGVETWLDRYLRNDISGSINKLRDQARVAARPLGLQDEFKELDGIIGALLGTRKVRLNSRAAIARAAGKPYDAARVTLFQVVADELQRNPILIPPADPRADPHLQAFIESYFSNYIEGTEFELEEAHEIVVTGAPMEYRKDDSHDILGTYRAILESKEKPRLPADADAFAALLAHWNRQVIESRQAKRPGEFKTEANRAGNTLFVAPELVRGTLEKGYETLMSTATPANRAALAMFVAAEVHPFNDGNGRTARLAMNLFLSEAGETRIIIPTVFREDYILALKALSTNSNPTPLMRMLTRAARFSRWVNMTSKTAAFADLKRSNSLERPHEAKLTFDGSA